MITFTNYDKEGGGDVRHHILSKEMSTAKRQRNHGNIQQQMDNIKETVSVHSNREKGNKRIWTECVGR
jgi:hypothetical protein